MFQAPGSSVLEVVAGPSFEGGKPPQSDIDALVSHFRTPQSHKLFKYWLDKCSDDDIPRRKSINPLDIKDLLPNLSIWEYVPEIEANRVRLVGTAITDALPYDTSGQLNTEVLPDEWNEAMQTEGANFYLEKRPLYFLLSMSPFERDFAFFEFISFPLRSKAEYADMGVGVFARVEEDQLRLEGRGPDGRPTRRK